MAQKPKSQKIKAANDYHKDSTGYLYFIIVVQLAVIAALVGSLYFLWLQRPEPTYFAATQDGKIFRIDNLDRPYLNLKQLNQWAVEAAVASYTFDFVNWQSNLNDVKEYYTENGYKRYLQALSNAGTIDTIRSKQLVSSAVATGAPVINKEGRDQNTGRYFWEVQIPMLVTYQSASEVIPARLLVTLTVFRVPVTESPKGIGIESIQVRQTTGAVG